MEDDSSTTRREPPIADELRALVEQAHGGDAGGLARIRQILDDEDPAIWDHFDMLASRVEHVWRAVVAAEGPATAKAMTKTVEKMRRELAGDSSSRMEKMLVEKVIGNFMEIDYLRRIAADPAQTGLAGECGKRLDSAYLRHAAALQLLRTFRELIPRGSAASVALWIFRPEPLTDPSADGPSSLEEL